MAVIESSFWKYFGDRILLGSWKVREKMVLKNSFKSDWPRLHSDCFLKQSINQFLQVASHLIVRTDFMSGGDVIVSQNDQSINQ